MQLGTPVHRRDLLGGNHAKAMRMQERGEFFHMAQGMPTAPKGPVQFLETVGRDAACGAEPMVQHKKAPHLEGFPQFLEQ